ncbi:mRNA splicing factor, partial [Mycena amicta]
MDSSLAATSEARKARLLALRRRKDGLDGGESILKNRNFDPETRTLKKRPIFQDDAEMKDTVENDVAGLAEKIILEDERRRAQELDIFNIAPKRPNWDLKREMDKKLAKLQRRTQESIHTLIRQRLAEQKGDSGDIAGAMRAQEKAQNDDDEENDD